LRIVKKGRNPSNVIRDLNRAVHFEKRIPQRKDLGNGSTRVEQRKR